MLFSLSYVKYSSQHSVLVSDNLNIWPFIEVRVKVSHPYKTCKIVVIYIVIFAFLLVRNGSKKESDLNGRIPL